MSEDPHRYRPSSPVANYWKNRNPCPDCGHSSYLYGCTCENEHCRCRAKRRASASSDTY